MNEEKLKTEELKLTGRPYLKLTEEGILELLEKPRVKAKIREIVKGEEVMRDE